MKKADLWEKLRRLHPLQAAEKKTTGGGGYKTSHPAQGERPAGTGPYYKKLLRRGKVIHWIHEQIWSKNTKYTKVQVRIHIPLVF